MRAAGIDLGFARDSAAIAFAEDIDGIDYVIGGEQIRGGMATDPRLVIPSFAGQCVKRGVESVMADVHYRQEMRLELAEHDLGLLDAPNPPWFAWLHWRRRMAEGKCRIPRSMTTLLRQLKKVRAKPKPGGVIEIVHGRTDGAHGDLAAATCLAIWQLRAEVRQTGKMDRVRSRESDWHSPAQRGRMVMRAEDLPEYEDAPLFSDRWGDLGDRWST